MTVRVLQQRIMGPHAFFVLCQRPSGLSFASDIILYADDTESPTHPKS